MPYVKKPHTFTFMVIDEHTTRDQISDFFNAVDYYVTDFCRGDHGFLIEFGGPTALDPVSGRWGQALIREDGFRDNPEAVFIGGPLDASPDYKQV